jgi:diguanylate cyclase (GGDEF)-like protein
MTTESRILLVEPQESTRTTLRQSIEALSYLVEAVASKREAAAALEQFQPEIILISSTQLSEDFCQYVRELAPLPAAIVVMFPKGTRQPDVRAGELTADGGFTKPIAREAFSVLLQMSHRVALLRRELAQLGHRVEELGDRLERLGDARPGQRFYHYEFFKHLLLVEIRRAKRYKFPLSVCLVEIDPYEIPAEHLMYRREIRSGVARAVSESIRDIDIPVYVGGERILVVLPHTPIIGAKKVARRISRLIREGYYPLGDDVIKVTASIGVAGLGPEGALSFSQLIKEAQAALEAARDAGGDGVIARGA